MENMIDNFINGNINTASEQAKKLSAKKIREAFEAYGFTFKKATLTAEFLKTGEGWQEACDAL